MLTAKEARNIKERSESAELQLQQIEKQIRAACIEEKDFIWFYHQLKGGVKTELEKCGYTVDSQYDQRESGYLVKISWAKQSAK